MTWKPVTVCGREALILPDVNLLVYAVDESSAFHAAANAWLDDALSSTNLVGFCYPTILGFVRLATNRRVFSNPLSLEEAVNYVDRWLEQPNAGIVVPMSRHWPLVKELLSDAGTAGNLTTDAHIAALAMEHGYTVYSNDADFGRFRKVAWINPLSTHRS